MTNATCPDLHLTTNAGASVYHFRISSVVCDQAGNPSSPVSVKLRGKNNLRLNYKCSTIVTFSFSSCSSQCSPSEDHSWVLDDK